jgi:hypothetical protein
MPANHSRSSPPGNAKSVPVSIIASIIVRIAPDDAARSRRLRHLRHRLLQRRQLPPPRIARGEERRRRLEETVEARELRGRPPAPAPAASKGPTTSGRSATPVSSSVQSEQARTRWRTGAGNANVASGTRRVAAPPRRKAGMRRRRSNGCTVVLRRGEPQRVWESVPSGDPRQP